MPFFADYGAAKFAAGSANKGRNARDINPRDLWRRGRTRSGRNRIPIILTVEKFALQQKRGASLTGSSGPPLPRVLTRCILLATDDVRTVRHRSLELSGRRKAVANQVVWVDIPVADLDRAVRFYSAVLGNPVQKQEYPGMTIGLLPGGDSDVSGCLFTKADDGPCDRGVLVYFNAQGRLDEAIAAVESNGGKVILPKHQIGPHGFRAVVLDSEGNRVALHSR